MGAHPPDPAEDQGARRAGVLHPADRRPRLVPRRPRPPDRVRPPPPAGALNNFDRVLPAPQSDLARETLKDPYIFDFLSLGPDVAERDLERGLISEVRNFLLELGAGFALVGTQVLLEVDGQDFFLDLLFYHLRLRCYVVVELKVGEFLPEHAGKMSFYLSAVDHHLRHPDDQPTIGLILCKTKSRLVAEYTLQGLQRPIGVASYQRMPEPLRGTLPSPAELEAGLGALKPLQPGREAVHPERVEG